MAARFWLHLLLCGKCPSMDRELTSMATFDRFSIKVVAGVGLCGAAIALSPDAAAAPLKTGGYACMQGAAGEVAAPAAAGGAIAAGGRRRCGGLCARGRSTRRNERCASGCRGSRRCSGACWRSRSGGCSDSGRCADTRRCSRSGRRPGSGGRPSTGCSCRCSADCARRRSSGPGCCAHGRRWR